MKKWIKYPVKPSKSQVKNLTDADLNAVSGGTSGTIKYPVIVRFAIVDTAEVQASPYRRGSKVRIM